MAINAKPDAPLSCSRFLAACLLPEISMGLITKEEADDIQDAEYEEIIDKSAKSNKLAEIAAKAAGVKDHPRPEQPTDQTQDYANNKPTRKSLL